MKIRPLKKKETKNINKKNLGFLEVPITNSSKSNDTNQD